MADPLSSGLDAAVGVTDPAEAPISLGWEPARGDVIWADFEMRAQHGIELSRRPALVVSPHAYNARSGLALVCLVTSRTLGNPFDVPLPTGLVAQGEVLSDQVRTIDWRQRHAVCVSRVPASTVSEVISRLGALLSGTTPA